MHRSGRPAFAAAIASMLFCCSGVGHAGTPAQLCAGSKLKATGKAAGVKLGCHSKAAKQGAVVDGGCLANADAKLTNAFAKAEARGGCATTGDVGDVDAILDSNVGAFVAALRPTTTADRCAALKLSATGKKARAKLGCYGKAARRGYVVDAGCLAKAEAHFVAVFASAESRGGCLTTSDAGDIEAQVDDLVAHVVAVVPTQPSTTTSTTTSSSTSTTGTPVCGNGIREGTEQCDTTTDQAFCGDRFGCFPAGSPRECQCCTPAGGVSQWTFNPDLDVCCEGLPPEPAGPGHYVCPGTCTLGTFPTCGGSCAYPNVCAAVILNGMSYCGCAPNAPCGGTCTGSPACCTGAVCSNPGEACDASTCSCVVP
jgi:hypothetical protein